MLWRSANEVSTHWRRDYAQTGPPIVLAYRQSPRLMIPTSGFNVTSDDPPFNVTSMASMAVDARGRLRALSILPPQLDSSLAGMPPEHLVDLFAFAGLDTAAFREVPPIWVPLPAFDVRREWVGPMPWLAPDGHPATARVTAAWWRGRPVSFIVRGPWDRPLRQEPGRRIGNAIAGIVFLVLILVTIVFGMVTGRRRLQGGGGDWRGGVRLASFMLICRIALWAVVAHHTSDVQNEFNALAIATGLGLVQAAFLFFLYVAVEPLVRKHTPELLIGWARVLQRRFNDPRVGRDVLVGAVFGSVALVALAIVNALPTWIPFHGQTPIPPNYGALAGGRLFAAALLDTPGQVLVPTFALFAGWFLLRLVLRRASLAALALAVIISLGALGAENPVLEVPNALLYGVLLAWVIVRWGLLALISAAVFRWLYTVTPLPFTTTSPYAFQAVFGIVVILALALWAFRTSLGGRPVFAFTLDD
jgi:hypothetical protein